MNFKITKALFAAGISWAFCTALGMVGTMSPYSDVRGVSALTVAIFGTFAFLALMFAFMEFFMQLLSPRSHSNRY